MPKIIQVIETYETEGAGIVSSPYRRVLKHYSFEGDLLLEDNRFMYEMLKVNHEKLEKEYKALEEKYTDLINQYNTIVMSADKRKASRDLASKRKK